MKIKLFFIIIFIIFPVFIISSLSNFEEGERLVMWNKPNEARLFLERALNEEPNNEKVYNYLGIVYEQLGENKKAISILQRGLDKAKTIKHSFYNNIGNNFSTLGENTLAEEMYTMAISLKSNDALAYLGRANCRINLKEYKGALNDFVKFLELNPATEKRPQIEKVIVALRYFLEGEEARLKDKLEREKALIDSVLNSLKNASDDASNLSLDSDVILEEEGGEVDIED